MDDIIFKILEKILEIIFHPLMGVMLLIYLTYKLMSLELKDTLYGTVLLIHDEQKKNKFFIVDLIVNAIRIWIIDSLLSQSFLMGHEDIEGLGIWNNLSDSELHVILKENMKNHNI